MPAWIEASPEGLMDLKALHKIRVWWVILSFKIVIVLRESERKSDLWRWYVSKCNWQWHTYRSKHSANQGDNAGGRPRIEDERLSRRRWVVGSGRPAGSRPGTRWTTPRSIRPSRPTPSNVVSSNVVGRSNAVQLPPWIILMQIISMCKFKRNLEYTILFRCWKSGLPKFMKVWK